MPIMNPQLANDLTEARDDVARRGRPSDVSDPVRVTVSLTPEQLDWLDAQPADSRSQAVRHAIDQSRGTDDSTPAIDLEKTNADLVGKPANQVIQWAADTFGDGLLLSTSFGVQSAVMLHLVTQVKPDIPVVFIDTGFHFLDTYRFADRLAERLNLNLKVYQAPHSSAWTLARHGKLWEQGEEGMTKLDRIHKVGPMQRALRELKATATLAGLRRGQTEHRQNLPHVVRQGERYKVHPILTWTTKDIHDYLTEHDLPFHPLHDQGYASVGDWYNTLPVTADQHEREGRFGGLKQECGLHVPESQEEDESRFSSGL